MNSRNCLRRQTLIYLFLPTLILSSLEKADGQVRDAEPAKNSTKKIRIQPNALAARAGSAINWVDRFDAAMQKSKASGKPVFWYVPTIPGTFMDRKPVIDRYMMAGYFSWPDIISHLNEHYVAFKGPPTEELQQKYELSRYKFIEPGFVIIEPNGSLKSKVDRITTQHPVWMLNFLSPGSGDIATSSLFEDPVAKRLRETMKMFQRGEHEAAQKSWAKIASDHPDHPLGWKAAAEAQGIGPFVRGFEVFVDLPARSLLAGIESAGSAAPDKTFNQSELRDRSIDFLLSMQRRDGGFYDSDYDFGGTDSLPNVHVAVTALAGMALHAWRGSVDPAKRASVEQAVARSLNFVTNEQNMNRIDRDEILWADAYRLRLISRCFATKEQPELQQPLRDAVKALENLQTRRGTWYHEYENPFVTATALTALFEAQPFAKLNSDKIDSGVSILQKLRRNDGSFPYGARRGNGGPKAVPASAGRMPLCELALHQWGKSDQTRLRYAIDQSFEFHRHLDSALKYDNHTSTFGYGGFFFWYDMRSRTEAIAAIQDRNLRNQLMRKQLEIIMRLPELDGCFVDSHELGRCYGTAMALLCLDRINQELKD